MQIQVVIEKVQGDGYVARSVPLADLTARGDSREEALSKLREMVDARLRQGTELTTLELADSENPWIRYAGMFKDCPMFDEVVEIMAENRKRMEEDPNVL